MPSENDDAIEVDIADSLITVRPGNNERYATVTLEVRANPYATFELYIDAAEVIPFRDALTKAIEISTTKAAKWIARQQEE